MARVVVLDASALIALYADKDTHHFWALGLFRDTVEFEWQMSVLNFAEAQVHPHRAGVGEQFLAATNRLGVEIMPLAADCAAELASLRTKTGLKMPDVITLHLAMKSGGTVATCDASLARAARELSIGVFAPATKK